MRPNKSSRLVRRMRGWRANCKHPGKTAERRLTCREQSAVHARGRQKSTAIRSRTHTRLVMGAVLLIVVLLLPWANNNDVLAGRGRWQTAYKHGAGNEMMQKRAASFVCVCRERRRRRAEEQDVSERWTLLEAGRVGNACACACESRMRDVLSRRAFAASRLLLLPCARWSKLQKLFHSHLPQPAPTS